MTELRKFLETRKSDRFFAEELNNPLSVEEFSNLSKKLQRHKISLFLLSDDAGRLKPEPQYSRTGKGKIRGKSSDEIDRDDFILKFSASAEGRAYIEEVRLGVISLLKQHEKIERLPDCHLVSH